MNVRRGLCPQGFEVGTLNEESAGAWAGLVSHGFGLSEARINHFRAAVGDAEVRLIRSDGRIAGTATLLPMAQYYGGQAVPVVGFAGVTVAASERRRGVADALLRGLLMEARGRGQALAVLYAATLPLYQRLGFARAGVSTDYALTVRKTLAPLVLSRRRLPLRLDRRPALDPAPLAALRRRQARWSNGLVERPPLLWANLLTPCGLEAPELHLILGHDGRPEGYILVHHVCEGRTVRLADVCLLSGGAAQQVLSFLAVACQRAESVAWSGGPEDSLVQLAPEGEIGIDDWVPWLARVVDVPAALAGRGYPAAVTAQLDLEIDDNVLTANHGRWRLSVSEGRATVERRPAHDNSVPCLELPVSVLAPLFTGHLTAPALRAMSMLEGRDAAINLGLILFGGAAPWLADRF